MKRFVVIGLGNFGTAVAESLYSQGHDIIAVDVNENAVDRIAGKVTRAAVGDGKQLAVLEHVRARGADAAVVSTGDDITASVLATMALRDLGIPDIYVKVISADHARVMEKLGVTETIFPERESGQRLSTRLTGRALLNYVNLGPDFSIQEMAVPMSWVGKTLRQLELPSRFRVSVVALHDALRDQITSVPDPDAVLKLSDALFVAGTDEDLEAVAQEQ